MAAYEANAYETARAANIKRNQALLAELNLQHRNLSASRQSASSGSLQKAVPKKRKSLQTTIPSRNSARLVNRPRPTYNEDAITASKLTPTDSGRSQRSRNSNKRQRINEPRTQAASSARTGLDDVKASAFEPASNIEQITAGWVDWTPSARAPTRDEEGTFHFEDEPTFTPNKSPSEMIREGSFGGSYWRPLRSRRLGTVIENDWKELPADWIEGLDVDKFLISPEYDADINKYKVACGQSIEEWEAAGWIDHDHDVRGWFQWYCRFFQGRRCDDDGRQISRWRKCVGETGRWRRILLKKYVQLGVRSVFDDGEDEDAPEVSPVIHQTCHHWAYEVRQEALDRFWAGS